MISVVRGSILDFPGGEGSAIVNPANSFLRHDGGLAKIIADAAAPRDAGVLDRAGVAWHEAQAGAPLIATGNVHATGAGRLPYQAIIHAVGPIWNGGHFCERNLLRGVHDEAMATADSLNITRIAFPAISCGRSGFPAELAAPLAIAAVSVWDQFDIEITFVLFSEEHYAAYTHAFQEAST